MDRPFKHQQRTLRSVAIKQSPRAATTFTDLRFNEFTTSKTAGDVQPYLIRLPASKAHHQECTIIHVDSDYTIWCGIQAKRKSMRGDTTSDTYFNDTLQDDFQQPLFRIQQTPITNHPALLTILLPPIHLE